MDGFLKNQTNALLRLVDGYIAVEDGVIAVRAVGDEPSEGQLQALADVKREIRSYAETNPAAAAEALVRLAR